MPRAEGSTCAFALRIRLRRLGRGLVGEGEEEEEERGVPVYGDFVGGVAAFLVGVGGGGEGATWGVGAAVGWDACVGSSGE